MCYQQTYYKRRRKGEDICPKCGGKRDREGRVYCSECAEKNAASSRKSRIKKYGSFKKWEKVHCNRAKMLYQKRKEAGLCTACGKAPVYMGYSRCLDCLERQRKYNKKLRSKDATARLQLYKIDTEHMDICLNCTREDCPGECELIRRK